MIFRPNQTSRNPIRISQEEKYYSHPLSSMISNTHHIMMSDISKCLQKSINWMSLGHFCLLCIIMMNLQTLQRFRCNRDPQILSGTFSFQSIFSPLQLKICDAMQTSCWSFWTIQTLKCLKRMSERISPFCKMNNRSGEKRREKQDSCLPVAVEMVINDREEENNRSRSLRDLGTRESWQKQLKKSQGETKVTGTGGNNRPGVRLTEGRKNRVIRGEETTTTLSANVIFSREKCFVQALHTRFWRWCWLQ